MIKVLDLIGPKLLGKYVQTLFMGLGLLSLASGYFHKFSVVRSFIKTILSRWGF